MLPNSDKSQDREASAGRARTPRLNVVVGAPERADLAVFKLPNSARLTSPAAAQLGFGAVEGTVGASISRAEGQSYDSGSRTMLSGTPIGPGQPSEATVGPGLRASLITELREISGQVNRMMSQVDRAIQRLGEHAGAPLRR